jgi:hypothetical protein
MPTHISYRDEARDLTIETDDQFLSYRDEERTVLVPMKSISTVVVLSENLGTNYLRIIGEGTTLYDMEVTEQDTAFDLQKELLELIAGLKGA